MTFQKSSFPNPAGFIVILVVCFKRHCKNAKDSLISLAAIAKPLPICSLQHPWLYTANNQLSDRSLQRCLTPGGRVTNMLAGNEKALTSCFHGRESAESGEPIPYREHKALLTWKSFCKYFPVFFPSVYLYSTSLFKTTIHQTLEFLVSTICALFLHLISLL